MASWFGPNEWKPHGDKVRPLAVATAKPIAVKPDLPTFRSKGYDLLSSVYHGVGVPEGTPADVIAKLESVFLKIAKDPETERTKLAAGIIPIAMPAAEAEALIADRLEAWKPIVEEFAK